MNPSSLASWLPTANDCETERRHVRTPRSPLPPDPRPDERPRPRPARAVGPDDRPPRPGVRRPRRRSGRAPAARLPHVGAGRHLPVVRHGRVGGRARQHALAGRSRARVRDRPLRDVVAHAGRAPRPRGRARPGRLAPRRRPRGRARAPHRGRAPAGRRSAPSASSTTRRRPASRAASPRCGRRWTRPATTRSCSSTRSRRSARSTTATTTWGVDVTVGCSQKGLMLPPGLGFNAVSERALEASRLGAAAARILGLGPDHRGEPRRRVPVHAADEPALRAARGARPAARRGPRRRVRPPRAPRGGDAPRRPRVGARRSCRSTTASTPPR